MSPRVTYSAHTLDARRRSAPRRPPAAAAAAGPRARGHRRSAVLVLPARDAPGRRGPRPVLRRLRARGGRRRPRGGRAPRHPGAAPDARAVARPGRRRLGVVVGFPLLTSLALRPRRLARTAPCVVGMLPAVTAAWAVLRAGERPSRPVLGWRPAPACGRARLRPHAGRRPASAPPTLELLAAVVLCALGYAEGGALVARARRRADVCWALVLALPLTLRRPRSPRGTAGGARGHHAWLGFAYVSTISMFLGFFVWYAGPGARRRGQGGQIQLAPAAADARAGRRSILGEHVEPADRRSARLAVLSASWRPSARGSCGWIRRSDRVRPT